MEYSENLIQGEFMALPEDLVRPETQISSKLFSVSDFELHPVNSMLEAWVPNDTRRLVLSLAVQMTDGFDEVESLRRYIIDNGLSRERNLLGIHRLGNAGLIPEFQG
jgi:hypothetical protein